MPERSRRDYALWLGDVCFIAADMFKGDASTTPTALLTTLDTNAKNLLSSGRVSDARTARLVAAKLYFDTALRVSALRSLHRRAFYKHVLASHPLGASAINQFSDDAITTFLALIYADYTIPEIWMASEAVSALAELTAYSDGAPISARDTLWSISHATPPGSSVSAGPPTAYATLKGYRRERNRPAKAQLATVIQAMIARAGRNSGAGAKSSLEKAISTKHIARALSLKHAIAEPLDMFVDRMADFFNTRDDTYERMEFLDPISRMEFATMLMSVFPTRVEGRKHLAKLAATGSGATGASAKFLRSPMHPDQVIKTLEAFEFKAGARDWEVDAVGKGLWATKVEATTAIANAAKLNKAILDVYGSYCAVAQANLQLTLFKHSSLAADASLLTRVKTYFNPATRFPDPSSGPTTTSKAAKILGLAGSIYTLTQTIEKLEKRPALKGEDLFTLAKDINSTVGAASSVVSALAKSGGGWSNAAATVSRYTGVVTVIFCVGDVYISTNKLFEAKTAEEAFIHAASIGASALTALSVIGGGLRAVPHPVALGAGAVATMLSLYLGEWLASLPIAHQADALKATHFSVTSRKKRHFAAETARKALGQNEVLDDLFLTMTKVKGSEDLPRQIAMVLGVGGAFTLSTHAGAPVVTLNSTRKLPGYTPKPSGADPDLAKTVLPSGAELDLYDASKVQRNAAQLAPDADKRLPTHLTVGISSPTTEITNAADDTLTQEDDTKVITMQIAKPDIFEAVVTLQSPAWPALPSARRSTAPPQATILMRVPVL